LDKGCAPLRTGQNVGLSFMIPKQVVAEPIVLDGNNPQETKQLTGHSYPATPAALKIQFSGPSIQNTHAYRKTKRNVTTRAETGLLRAALVISAPRHALARPPRTLVAVEAAGVVVLLITLGTLTSAVGFATHLPRYSWT
jgi:hypothetical protein